MKRLAIFWWVFAIRGGLAVLFAGVLSFSGSLLGTIFFDPVTLVFLSLLLGSYVLGNAILYGVAGGFAIEHRDRHGWLMLGESCFAIVLAIYIGGSLLVTAHSLALLAGIHALGTGCFQACLAAKVRQQPSDRFYLLLLGGCAVVSLCVGAAFLANHTESLPPVTHWLSLYELFYGLTTIVFSYGLRRETAPVQW
jgi:uncharacterized membrane protein HdeD (DUF308 family)